MNRKEMSTWKSQFRLVTLKIALLKLLYSTLSSMRFISFKRREILCSRQRCKWIERTTESSNSSASERGKLEKRLRSVAFSYVTMGGVVFERLHKNGFLCLCIRSSDEHACEKL